MCTKNEQNRVCKSIIINNTVILSVLYYIDTLYYYIILYYTDNNIIYNFLNVSVERILMIAGPSGKKSKVYMRSKVSDFDGAIEQ